MNIHHKTIHLRNNCGYYIWKYTVSNYARVGSFASRLKTSIVAESYSTRYVLSESLQHMGCGSIMSNLSSVIKVRYTGQ
jgi:hypothetical protein